jgi:hypothetical protein
MMDCFRGAGILPASFFWAREERKRRRHNFSESTHKSSFDLGFLKPI